jgi:exopolyphosphatase / guanosine-5'-triphosphate,3'-diphosphate pyrophosphatase
LNLRPPGYEPGELPDCSTPRREAHSSILMVMKRRVAAVDLGTNSTRLLVADVKEGEIQELARDLEITGLGEGVDERRKLLPLPITRVRNVLTRFRRQIEALGVERTLAVGTSAVRDADNGEAFLGEVEWSYGFETRLLSGEEEARLTFLGATLGRDDDGVLVIDLGGGSTELVTAEDAISTELGSVRLTERFGEDVEAIARFVRDHLPELSPERAIGVAGTITQLAALDLELDAYHPAQIEGHRMSLDSVERLRNRLAAMSVEERAALPAFEPGRAPFIVTGATIVAEVVRGYGLTKLEVSERDLLHAVALEAADLPAADDGGVPPSAYTCC